MKTIFTILFVASTVSYASAFQPETNTYVLSDGEEITGRLCLPDEGIFNTVVVAIHGTGIQNHLNVRKGGGMEFNFYDELAR